MIAALIVSVLVLNVHVGMAAFAGAAILVLSGAGDDGEAREADMARDRHGVRRPC